jgi:hypothetical protein
MTASAETAAAASPLPGRRPDFFIVGHPKCGTTALYSMLRAHPQIYMPDLNEPRFLASDLRDRFHVALAGPLPDTLEEYLALFEPAGPGQLAGEASPTYLSSRTAAQAIAELQPRARIVAILREPASFVRSMHMQYVQGHIETERDLRKALELEPARRRGERLPRNSHRPDVLLYSDHVRYVEQLHRYHDVFAPEQVLVLIYDDFRRDNEATIRTVLRFLDVEDTPPTTTREVNPTVRVRGQPLYELAHAISVGRDPLSRTARALVKRLSPPGLTRESAIAVRDRFLFAPPSSVDEGLLLELRRRFKREVVDVSEYLGRDLVTEWGYDGIG